MGADTSLSRIEHMEKDLHTWYEALSLAIDNLEKELEIILLKEKPEPVKNELAPPKFELNFSPLEILMQKHRDNLMSLKDRIVSITTRIAI